ncbi:MAG TPA: hypothetical protein VFE53_08355 [Mucilaginibacter sp.]|jgi:hypothetical protein|nr:hypothetical protein [Mucilaginibacter sp.]
MVVSVMTADIIQVFKIQGEYLDVHELDEDLMALFHFGAEWGKAKLNLRQLYKLA